MEYAIIRCIKSRDYCKAMSEAFSGQELDKERKMSHTAPRFLCGKLYNNKPIAICGGTDFVLRPDHGTWKCQRTLVVSTMTVCRWMR